MTESNQVSKRDNHGKTSKFYLNPTDPSPYRSQNQKFYNIESEVKFDKSEREKIHTDLVSLNSYASPLQNKLDLSAARERNRQSYYNVFNQSEAHRFNTQNQGDSHSTPFKQLKSDYSVS